jgi:hypothetical protein
MNNQMEYLKKSIDNNEWSFKYDKDSDSLFFAKTNSSFQGTALISVDDKYVAVRLNKEGMIVGIIVENFFDLFLSENPDFIPLAQSIEKRSAVAINANVYLKSLLWDTTSSYKQVLSPGYMPVLA